MKAGCWCCTCAHASDPVTGCAASGRAAVQAWINSWADHRTITHGTDDVYAHPPVGLGKCPGHQRPDAVVDQLDLLAAP